MASTYTTSLARSIQIQARITHALLMREIITRFGRHNIGFAWLFAEPMLFTGGIAALWNVLELNAASHAINITAYALTGYPTILMWRNAIGRCTMAITPNLSLLVHKNVRPTDFFISRIILEIAGVTISTMIMLGISIAIGLIKPPADILIMLKGWALLTWYSAAMALIIGSLCEFNEVVEKLWHPIGYFQLPISGAFAMASWLPAKVRAFVLCFPAPNCVEIFRAGYFGDSIRPYYNTGYTCAVCLILTWLGLILARAASRQLDAR